MNLCKIGIHKWTFIPRDIAARAKKAGMAAPPDWYAGRKTREWCWRCGEEK